MWWRPMGEDELVIGAQKEIWVLLDLVCEYICSLVQLLKKTNAMLEIISIKAFVGMVI